MSTNGAVYLIHFDKRYHHAQHPARARQTNTKGDEAMTTPYASDYETFERLSAEHRRLLRQEELIVEVTEAIACALKEVQLTQSQLAERLGKTKGFVSQILGGGRNLTLRTLSDVADALECYIRVEISPESGLAGGSTLRNEEIEALRARIQKLEAAISYAESELHEFEAEDGHRYRIYPGESWMGQLPKSKEWVGGLRQRNINAAVWAECLRLAARERELLALTHEMAAMLKKHQVRIPNSDRPELDSLLCEELRQKADGERKP